MTELAKHIEVLLLDNDCVIVPGFGGFMAHSVSSVFNEEENLFLPPGRTLGFNPQLKLNDSLLAQSYVEAYDLSYPEALRRIEDDVEEIKQTLAAQGTYELPDIGVILLKSEGTYDFEPCISGILTPNLYALNSFEMPMLDKMNKNASDASAENEVAENDVVEEETTARVISINVDKLKHTLATAAVVLLLILFSIPFGENKRNELRLCSIDSNMLFRVLPHIEENGNMPDFMIKTDASKQKTVSPEDMAENKLVQDAFNLPSETEKVAKTPDVKQEQTAEKAKAVATSARTDVASKQEKADTYVIVLASNVSRTNAEAYVSTLKKSGIKDARILEGKHLKVVCGSYTDIPAASSELNKLKETNKAVTDGWFLKIG